MFLYILLSLAVLFILAQAYLIYLYVKRIQKLSTDYDALDRGMVEITDAYETDSLQYEETIENLNEHKILLQHQYADLSEKYAGVRRANDEYHQENLGLRRQLDIAQRVISEHDLNCLPHIVLSSMEEDTPLPL